MRPLPMLVTTAVLLAAAPAHASVATVEDSPTVNSPLVHYAAAPGEANALEIAFSKAAKTVTLTDQGATITPGPGCSTVSAHVVKCAVEEYFYRAKVELSDGDDTLTTAPKSAQLVVDAGAGNDEVTGTDMFGDDIDGGPGADTLHGNGNVDTFYDSDTDPDVFDGGGEEYDTVTFENRLTGVEVHGKTTAEGDQLQSIEELYGTPFADVLVTGNGKQTLHGLDGGDELRGGNGADWIQGGQDRDIIDAGSGNDSIDPGTGRDAVHCGDGNDGVRESIAAEYLHGCEGVGFADVGQSDTTLGVDLAPKLIAPRVLRYGVGCEESDEFDGEPTPCHNIVKLRTRSGKLIARGVTDGDGSHHVEHTDLKVTTFGARYIARRGGVRVTGTVKLPDTQVGWTSTLRV